MKHSSQSDRKEEKLAHTSIQPCKVNPCFYLSLHFLSFQTNLNNVEQQHSQLYFRETRDTGGTTLQQILIYFGVLGCLSIVIYLVRCFLQRRATRRAPLLENCNNGGLDAAAIATLPTFPYRRCGVNKNGGGGEENNGSSMECSICLSTIEEGEMVKLLPECTHSFHSECVDLWLGGHATCPVCRIEVLGSRRVVRQPNRIAIVAVLDLER